MENSKEIRIPGYLTCLLRNLYTGQEATVRTEHGRTDWFKIGKGVGQGCILSPCSFNLYTEYIEQNSRLNEAQAGNQDCREKCQESQMCRWYHSNGRKWRVTKEPLDEGEREDWKSWLKTEHSKNWDHGIWSHHLMANRWGKSRNSDRLYLGGFQNHCRWWQQPWN